MRLITLIRTQCNMCTQNLSDNPPWCTSQGAQGGEEPSPGRGHAEGPARPSQVPPSSAAAPEQAPQGRNLSQKVLTISSIHTLLGTNTMSQTREHPPSPVGPSAPRTMFPGTGLHFSISKKVNYYSSVTKSWHILAIASLISLGQVIFQTSLFIKLILDFYMEIHCLPGYHCYSSGWNLHSQISTRGAKQSDLVFYFTLLWTGLSSQINTSLQGNHCSPSPPCTKIFTRCKIRYKQSTPLELWGWVLWKAAGVIREANNSCFCITANHTYPYYYLALTILRLQVCV